MPAEPRSEQILASPAENVAVTLARGGKFRLLIVVGFGLVAGFVFFLAARPPERNPISVYTWRQNPTAGGPRLQWRRHVDCGVRIRGVAPGPDGMIAFVGERDDAVAVGSGSERDPESGCSDLGTAGQNYLALLGVDGRLAWRQPLTISPRFLIRAGEEWIVAGEGPPNQGDAAAGSRKPGVGANPPDPLATAEIAIARYDRNGRLRGRQFVTRRDATFEGVSGLVPTAEGGFFLHGKTADEKPYLARYDLPSRRIVTMNLGGPVSIEIEQIRPTADGGAAIVGTIRGFAATLDAGLPTQAVLRGPRDYDFDAVIVKLDRVGRLQWGRTLSGEQIDMAEQIAEGEDGSLYVALATESREISVVQPGPTAGEARVNATVTLQGDTPSWNGLLLKFRPGGALAWSVVLAGSGEEWIAAIAGLADGGVVVAGTSLSPSLTFRDTAGSLVRQPNTSDLGISTLPDSFLIRFGPNGTLQWHRRIGGIRGDVVKTLHVDKRGSLTVGGHTGSARLSLGGDPDAVLANASAGRAVVFVASYDAGGRPTAALALSSPGDDYLNGCLHPPGDPASLYLYGSAATGDPETPQGRREEDFLARISWAP